MGGGGGVSSTNILCCARIFLLHDYHDYHEFPDVLKFLQAFVFSGCERFINANIFWKILVSLALFFSADIHQGDEHFSVHSRGKRCAFMSLSALLTARNIPLNLWSRITFKYALQQGDKIFLNALDRS